LKRDFEEHLRTTFECEHALLCSFGADMLTLDFRLRRMVRSEFPLILVDSAEFDNVARSLRRAGERYRLERATPYGRRFHPKVTALVGDGRWQIVVGSANLTVGGTSRNAELVGSTAGRLSSTGGPSAVAGLRDFLGCLRDLSAPPRAKGFIDAILAGLPEVEHEATEGPTLIHSYRASIAEQFLQRLSNRRVQRLVIVSPYWDDELEAAWTLAERARPDELVLLIDGSDAALPSNRRRLETLDLTLSVGLLKVAGATGAIRSLHAKALWAECDAEDLLFFGSANCTRAGMLLSAAQGGNVEAGAILALPAGRTEGLIVDIQDGADVEWVELSSVAAARPPEPSPPPVPGSPLSIREARVEGEFVVVEWDAPPAWEIVVHVERGVSWNRTDGGIGSGRAIAPIPGGKGTMLAHVETLDRLHHSQQIVVVAPQGLPTGPPGVADSDFYAALAVGGVAGWEKLFEIAFRHGETQASWLLDLLACWDVSLFFRPQLEPKVRRSIGSSTSVVPPFGYSSHSPKALVQAVSIAAGEGAGRGVSDWVAELLKREMRRVCAALEKRDRFSLEAASTRLLMILIYWCLQAEWHSAEAHKGHRRLHNLNQAWLQAWTVSDTLRQLNHAARLSPVGPAVTGSGGPSPFCSAAAQAGRAIAGAAFTHLKVPSGERLPTLDGRPVSLEEAVVGPYADCVGWYDEASRIIWT